MQQRTFTEHNTATKTKQSSPSEQTTEDETTQETSCPECSGNIQLDAGEHACVDCGLIVEEEHIDHGPEWRAFTSTEKDSKSRVGSPTTNLMHDNGLSTNIDWRDKDAYGNAISNKKRKQMSRLRTWNERFRTRDSKDRNLKMALTELDRMSSALGIPKSVRQVASAIYRRAYDEGLLPGRSTEAMISSALYAAARQEGLPRSLDDIAHVARVERKEISRTYIYMKSELGLAVPNPTAQEFLPRYSANLGLSDETEQIARDMLNKMYEGGHASGKAPTSLVAGAIYAASLISDDRYTQAEIGDAVDVTAVTIRNRYKEIHDVYMSSLGDISF